VVPHELEHLEPYAGECLGKLLSLCRVVLQLGANPLAQLRARRERCQLVFR